MGEGDSWNEKTDVYVVVHEFQHGSVWFSILTDIQVGLEIGLLEVF